VFISQDTTFFIVTAANTSELTNSVLYKPPCLSFSRVFVLPDPPLKMKNRGFTATSRANHGADNPVPADGGACYP
jgi:hypothetical protein